MTFFTKNFRSLWSSCKVIYVNNVNNLLLKNRIRLYTAQVEALPKKTVRSLQTKKKKFALDQFAWAMLVIPVSAFGLGTWQIFRKIRKEGLIEDLKQRTKLAPVELPKDLSQLQDMEFKPVKVKGKFDHSREIYLGPRSRVDEGRSSKTSSLLSTPSSGFIVITPFKLADRDLTILVNRGWVPKEKKSPTTRMEGQITGDTELVGLVRLTERRTPLGMKNIPEKGFWMYRDLEKMAEVTGSAPIFIDAVESSSVPGGPIPGQTIASLPNEHTVYIITWYSLSAITGKMWYDRFMHKIPHLIR